MLKELKQIATSMLAVVLILPLMCISAIWLTLYALAALLLGGKVTVKRKEKENAND